MNGQEAEPWKIIYFKVYKSQLPVIEHALETVTLMLGRDKSRGYCLEMKGSKSKIVAMVRRSGRSPVTQFAPLRFLSDQFRPIRTIGTESPQCKPLFFSCP
jgi:hypothetical protein